MTSDTSQEGRRDTGARSLDAALGELALARAADLARTGRYAEAERVLEEISPGDEHAAAQLDLLARIRVQQGRIADAEVLWSRLLELAPGFEGGEAALRRLRRLRRRPIWLGWALPALAAVMVAAGIAIPVWIVSNDIDDVRTAVVSEVEESSARDRAHADRLAGLASGGGSPRSVATTRAVRAAVQSPDVDARVDEREIVVTFRRGLFSRGTELRAPAGALLARLGRRLEPFARQIRITVIGYTDSLRPGAGGAYADNVSLGSARATTVAEFMRTRAGLPSGIFTVRSAGTGPSPPYSNDLPKHRARNRTAVVAISLTGP